MKFLKTLLICFLIHSCNCEVRRCKNCAQRKSDLTLEQLRQLRFEFFKNQILKKLHLTEAPKTNLPKPPLKSLLMIAEMAENETIFETDDQPKTENVVIYPNNENLTCSGSGSYPCHRFEFVVPDSLLLENYLSAEVWFYENQTRHFRVYQVITDYLQNLTTSFQLDKVAMERNSKSWIKYNVQIANIRSNMTTEEILVLEIMNYNSDICSGNEKPFLKIRSEKATELTRRKRSTNCMDSVSSCCKENFYLNFSEIGWDNWILHPDGYQANFCRGRCFNDLSNTRFYHSTVLLSYIRDNKDLAEEIGLNMCCTPSVMSPVTIIYRNEEGLIYHKSIENMKVEACNCA